MSKVSLNLTYHTPAGKLSVAEISDTSLLKRVARIAIKEAHASAEEMAAIDAVIGSVRFEEAMRLARVLALLIPDLTRG
jgi:hypothetical protein